MQLRQGIGFPSTSKKLVVFNRPICWQDPNKFYYRLGLTPTASDKEVRKAGRDLLRKYHPDGSDPDPERFRSVEEAYRCLRDNRAVYDATPADHVMVTDSNKGDPSLILFPIPRYSGWSYFSEVPRATDDSVALWAYEQYLEEALRTPTSLPRIAVALIQGEGPAWIEDGLVYVPVTGIQGRMETTPE